MLVILKLLKSYLLACSEFIPSALHLYIVDRLSIVFYEILSHVKPVHSRIIIWSPGYYSEATCDGHVPTLHLKIDTKIK